VKFGTAVYRGYREYRPSLVRTVGARAGVTVDNFSVADEMR